MTKHSILFFANILLIFSLVNSCQSDNDKKEQLTTSSKNEHQRPSIADVERGIRANIENNTKAGDGYFKIKKDTIDLNLKLVRVHTEYLSVLGPNKFFACVDLATTSGDVYDVDFFLEGTIDNMNVTSTDVHKLNGKPYYSWKQKQDKTWYTVAVKNSSNKLLGVVEGSDQFQFTYEVKLPEISENAKIWIPVAQNDQFQTVELISIEAPSEQKIVKDKKYNKQFFL